MAARTKKACDVSGEVHVHVTDKRWLDGPHFKDTDLKDGDEWDGRKAAYFVRCVDCDTIIETMYLPTDGYAGAKWSSQHKMFVYPNGGTPQRKVA